MSSASSLQRQEGMARPRDAHLFSPPRPREKPAAAQALGDVSCGDALREALGDGRLAHPRLA